MNENQLLEAITKYFKEVIFENHKNNVLKNHTKLSSYQINPILVKYLSKILEDNFTPLGIAKALYYPRVLGTSISTSFGTRIQKMFVELNLAKGSLIPEMDIEFVDKVDNRKKYCQLKSGPNTINAGDVGPLIRKFSKVSNLARTNTMSLNNSDLILGVLYGEQSQLSQHYKKIDATYPVYIGTEFWHRITGYSDFYAKLVSILDKMILELDTENFFEEGCQKLAVEIEASTLFDFE
ncbi:PmeII family type II restriction endonuclease [uncultured Arcticibacterium sp.]|uniref:PmeII family type II restriction endonuclease n=1 Tax=uncultured Arcticibacterium sp. TaxID=2173042 RepID=UPI0030FA009A